MIRKSQEEQKRAITEKKQRLQQALQRMLMTILKFFFSDEFFFIPPRKTLERKKIPTDLKNDALSLQNTLEWDDQASELVTSHEDDEYRWAGIEDPKVVITTSRDPSSRLKMFAKV